MKLLRVSGLFVLLFFSNVCYAQQNGTAVVNRPDWPDPYDWYFFGRDRALISPMHVWTEINSVPLPDPKVGFNFFVGDQYSDPTYKGPWKLEIVVEQLNVPLPINSETVIWAKDIPERKAPILYKGQKYAWIDECSPQITVLVAEGETWFVFPRITVPEAQDAEVLEHPEFPVEGRGGTIEKLAGAWMVWGF